MAIAVTSIDPGVVLADGAHEVIIVGGFDLGTAYRVHFGHGVATSDPIGYPAKPGQGSTVYPFQAGKIRVYTPELESSATLYDVMAVDLDTPDSGILVEVLRVMPQDYADKVFGLRQQFPPFYNTGPRDMRAAL